MLKQSITFENLEGDEITRDFYFNLNVAEITELEVEYPEGFVEHIESVVKSGDRKALMSLFKMLIRKSYGIKHEDGLRFVKSEEISDTFTQTDAYGRLLLELGQTPDAAANFFKGILPGKVLEKLAKAENGEITTPNRSDPPAWLKEQRDPTNDELWNMPKEEMVLAMQVKSAIDPKAKMKALLEEA